MEIRNNMKNDMKWYCSVCGLDLTYSTHGVTDKDTRSKGSGVNEIGEDKSKVPDPFDTL